MVIKILALVVIALVSSQGHGADWYVATDGSDSDPGTLAEPFLTIEHGMDQLSVGDTLFVRGGIYRESYLSVWPTGGTANTVTTVTSYQGEEVIVNSGTALDSAGDWTLQTGNIHKHSVSGTVRNLSQNGLPLRLVDTDLVNGDYTAIDGPGQWVRSTATNDVWVRPHGSAAIEDSNLEVSTNFYGFYVREDVDHITINGITAENSKYPYRIEGDYVSLTNCVARNAWGDAIKVEGWAGLNDDTVDEAGTYWDSEYGVIDNCDIYNFGEGGIDITGGDYWTVTNNKIHDGVPIHAEDHPTSPEGYYTLGIMTKNDSIGGTFKYNHIYNLRTNNGTMILGPNTTRILVPTASYTTIRYNRFENTRGPWILSFSGAQFNTLSDNIFIDNYVYNNGEAGTSGDPETLIQFRNGFCSAKSDVPDCESGGDNAAGNNTLLRNQYINNRATYIYHEVDSAGLNHDVGNVSADNLHSPVATASVFDGSTMDRASMAATKNYDIAGASPPNQPTGLGVTP